MGIFSRLGSLIKSNINDIISRAEDPEKMLNQVLLDMQSSLVEAKKQVAVAIADEKRLQKQLETEQEKAKEWERKAMVAVRANDDNLAREALSRKQEHDNIGAQYQTQWLAQKAAVDKLKDALRLLSNKIEEAKRKKNILVARKKRAEAQKTIASTMSGLSDTSAFDTFDRMSAKIDQLEAEAEAGSELAGELTGDSLDSKFAQLEASGVTAGGDNALAELKAKMGLGPAPASNQAQLPPASAKTATPTRLPATGSTMSAEDLKELDELNLDETSAKGG
jgi:phage shock protein A